MSSPSGAAQAHRLLIQLLCSCAASLLLLLSASLSACSVAANPPLSSANATASAHAQATKAAVATRTAAPVWVDVVAIVECTTSERNVRLRVTTTVTNWTGAPIHLAGTSPVISQSGTHRSTRMRTSCSKPLRNVLYQLARESIQREAWAKTYYERKRQEGKTFTMAVRALANQWVRILFAVWKNREGSDPQVFALAQRA